MSNPANETLFVGLYSAATGDRAEIDWLCPMTDLPPGEDKERPSDLYHLRPLDILSEHSGRLKIEWNGGKIGWDRYAGRNEFTIIGEVDTQPITDLDASPEGESIWRTQRGVERDSRLAKTPLSKNADENGGQYVCTACGFRHPDRAMFDAHHPHPLLAGPRMTQASDLIVLCPVCHRRAHRSVNRMLPYSLAELRRWNEDGRP